MSISLISTGVRFPDGNTVSSVSVFESGTAALFSQTTPPTGWTKVTTHNDKALRLVSGSVSSGGSVDFSSCFANKSFSSSFSNVDTYYSTMDIGNLADSQLPSHTHGASYVGVYATTLQHQYPGTSVTNYSSTSFNTGFAGGLFHGHQIVVYGHGHSAPSGVWPFSLQYVDVIIATKD